MGLAIVTGASSGIGEQFARQLAPRSDIDEIWLIARRFDRLARLASELGPLATAVPFVADLRDSSDIERIAERLRCREPSLRFLVNNAGYGKTGEFATDDQVQQLGMIDLNIRALVHLTHASLPYLKAGGNIINVASVAAFFPVPRLAVYAATKAFVVQFSLALGVELERRGVHVTAVCPGPVKTEFHVTSNPNGLPSVYHNLAVQSERVVRLALKHADGRRPVSVFGFPSRVAASVVSRIIPARQAARWASRLKH